MTRHTFIQVITIDIKIWLRLRLNAFTLLHNQSKATLNNLKPLFSLFLLRCLNIYVSLHWLKITLIGLLWWMSQDWYAPCICRVSALACLCCVGYVWKVTGDSSTDSFLPLTRAQHTFKQVKITEIIIRIYIFKHGTCHIEIVMLWHF